MQHPNHIITNILLRVQEEAKDQSLSTKSLKVQQGKITRLAKVVGLKHNTIIPTEWLHQFPLQYQAHLERISDYLVSRPGVWWRKVDNGIEFFDVSAPDA